MVSLHKATKLTFEEPASVCLCRFAKHTADGEV